MSEGNGEREPNETLAERRARAAERMREDRQAEVNEDIERRIEQHVGGALRDRLNGLDLNMNELPAKRLDQDDVNSPPHYQANGVEAIEVIEAFGLGFNLGNAVKYILRAGRKGGPEKRRVDLEKASWYLRRELGDR